MRKSNVNQRFNPPPKNKQTNKTQTKTNKNCFTNLFKKTYKSLTNVEITHMNDRLRESCCTRNCYSGNSDDAMALHRQSEHVTAFGLNDIQLLYMYLPCLSVSSI